MFSPSEMWHGFESAIYHKYANDPGKMLLHTGAIGWILSSAAQMTAIMMNDKLTTKDKLFLLPQEAGDAVVNIISFYTLTWGIKAIGEKLTKTCKIRTKELSDLLKKSGHVLDGKTPRLSDKSYAGDWNFNIKNLPDYEVKFRPYYEDFANGVAVATGLTGSVLSTNIVTPYARNYYAAQWQSDMISKIDAKKSNTQKDKTPITDISFNSFQRQAHLNPFRMSSGNMKI